ncbi:hypothetical protein HK104_002770 [Borealophlyctis nickersoniae]|nr:hypothetical protein HK104_002770 [Borealophlyctis nickersoniae]
MSHHRRHSSTGGVTTRSTTTRREDLNNATRDKVAKAGNSTATSDVSDLIIHLVNESSLGMYRIQEHVHKKVPQLVADKRDIRTLSSQLTRASSNLHDAHDIVQGMNRIDSFSRCTDYLNRIAIAVGDGGAVGGKGGKGSGK